MNLRRSLLAMAALTTAVPCKAMAQTTSARSELEQGYELRKRGDYVAALPHLLESYRLDPQLKTLINLADCEEHIGKLVDSIRHWGEARAQAARQDDNEIEEESGRRVSSLATRIPTLTLVVPAPSPPTLRIEEDGLPMSPASVGSAVPTDPGHHTLIVHVEGYEDRSIEVILKAGASVQISVMPGPRKAEAPNPASGSAALSPLRFVGPVATGVGALGLGVGTYFGLVAINKQENANCPRNVCTAPSGHPEILREAIGAGNLSTAFLVAGGVLAAGGVALWLLVPPSGERTSVAPAVLRDGAGASLIGRW